ncbi:UvrD-helicase domain-containing protein [Peribacillus simplex]|uniref:UvrD-helicase domain-containing protein n=1 Tax=Peribacillus simplex TaxID=1478 RepID=UPI0011A2C1AB|nr:UvrD-helicase domain-containing protein [Peribacillus simplex]
MVEELGKKAIDDVITCIETNKNFILEAGAGAGKTHTLIELINYIKNRNTSTNLFNKNTNILCITFTNVAKDEIFKRLLNKENITIATMHEFLWEFISPFQNELRKQVEIIIEDEIKKIDKKIDDTNRILLKPRRNTNIEKKNEELVKELKKKSKYVERNYKTVKYENYRALHKGIISHNDLLRISKELFKNKLFSNIFIDSYSHVFIDEFQDTNKDLLTSLLEVINEQKGEKQFVIGLFGDKMQQIYDGGISNIDNSFYGLEYIEKKENYRSCNEIVWANNLLRRDEFLQEPKSEEVIFDRLIFIYNLNEDKYLKRYAHIESNTYTRFFLTHKEIALELGFSSISVLFSEEYNNYSNDKLLKLEDEIIKYILEEIVFIIKEYENKNYNLIISRQKAKVVNFESLRKLNQDMNDIVKSGKLILKDVVNKLIEMKIIDKTKLNTIIKSYEDRDKIDFIDSLMNIELKEFLFLYSQIFENTGLRTLHGVKGEEFEKVIINIDENSTWTNYNFCNLFKNGLENENFISRKTHRLFYVGCTRAKQSLVINFINNITNDIERKQIIKNIKEFFGNEITIDVY